MVELHSHKLYFLTNFAKCKIASRYTSPHPQQNIIHTSHIHTLLVAQLAWSISVCAIPNKYCALFSPTLISQAINLVLHSFLWINITKNGTNWKFNEFHRIHLMPREKKISMKHLHIKHNFLLKQIERKKTWWNLGWRRSLLNFVFNTWVSKSLQSFLFYLSELNTFTCPVCWQARLNEIRPNINADKSIVEFRMYGQSVDIKFPIIFAKLLYSNRIIRQKRENRSRKEKRKDQKFMATVKIIRQPKCWHVKTSQVKSSIWKNTGKKNDWNKGKIKGRPKIAEKPKRLRKTFR